MEAFGVDKEMRMGEATAIGAGQDLNPSEFIDEEFARVAAARTKQVCGLNLKIKIKTKMVV
jgi:hypothetical protein